MNLLSCCETVADGVTKAFPAYEFPSLPFKVCITLLLLGGEANVGSLVALGSCMAFSNQLEATVCVLA